VEVVLQHQVAEMEMVEEEMEAMYQTEYSGQQHLLMEHQDQ
jgi:hypothetical protein